MDAAVPVSAVVAVVACFSIIGRFASAFAKRLEHPPREAAPPDPAVGELRQELEALQERVDFIERVLATQKEHTALPGGGERDQPDREARG